MERTKAQLSYNQWMQAIDAYLLELIFLDQSSLSDWLSRDAYNRGDTVLQGAEQCLEQSDYGMFIDGSFMQDEP